MLVVFLSFLNVGYRQLTLTNFLNRKNVGHYRFMSIYNIQNIWIAKEYSKVTNDQQGANEASSKANALLIGLIIWMISVTVFIICASIFW